MNYRTTCSCCGDYVNNKARLLPNNNDSEGNLCLQCYDEAELSEWFQYQELIEKVLNALNPINKLKFRYATPQHQRVTVLKLLDKGILTWQIG